MRVGDVLLGVLHRGVYHEWAIALNCWGRRLNIYLTILNLLCTGARSPMHGAYLLSAVIDPFEQGVLKRNAARCGLEVRCAVAEQL